MDFMTLTEIASAIYRHNSTATEYALGIALYRKLPDDQKRIVSEKGNALYSLGKKAA